MMIYPKFSEENVLTLKAIAAFIEKDPSWLEREECPYSETMKTQFRLWLAPRSSVVEAGSEPNMFDGQDDVKVLDQQIQIALTELQNLGVGLTDVNDKLTYMKSKAAMMEKLISLKERTQNLKEIAQFRDTLMEAVDQLCDKDTITAIMLRLKGVLGL